MDNNQHLYVDISNWPLDPHLRGSWGFLDRITEEDEVEEDMEDFDEADDIITPKKKKKKKRKKSKSTITGMTDEQVIF